MLDLAKAIDQAVQLPVQDRDQHIESVLLNQPQADCPVAHYFGPGVYVREVSMKAGTFAIGHRQKFPHLNVLLQGAVEMLNEDGSTDVVRAPLIFTGQPGRKVGLVLEDVIWLNVYAAEQADPAVLEDRFVDKSPDWLAHQAAKQAANQASTPTLATEQGESPCL